MLELAQDIGLLFNLWALTPELRKALLTYIIQAGNTHSVSDFTRILTENLPQHQEEIMTIAQQLEQIGFNKGMEQGIKISAQQIAHQLLLKGIDSDTVQQITGLTQDEVEQLAQKSSLA